ncbi:RimK/LysX family protein [Marinilongibacter aquaticus]|uniref:ATP-dependent zinc protease family protein n=1 Tax=Marinilongibacter aquaticus TaxID=2975157 RepID=UPI0021BD8D18|nr:RimK/LysX family protein [Marinilongibacter aquaticus]UBM57545.1 RimK/LysX family protein [Marinilongibacter aquaticus]
MSLGGNRPEMKIIGRKEKVQLPELGLFGVRAKIDTGAYTSSLHCLSAKESNGRLLCQFEEKHKEKTLIKTVPFAKFTKRKVRSSNGQLDDRYAIKTKIGIGKETLDIELTLSDRGKMKTEMLLGRKFLRKRYMVDVSTKYRLSK